MTCVVRATLIRFFTVATLSGELVGGMWSTQAQCWRVIVSRLTGRLGTKTTKQGAIS
jgi:hypothetical protein